MRLLAFAALVAISSVTGPAIAQQTTPEAPERGGQGHQDTKLRRVGIRR